MEKFVAYKRPLWQLVSKNECSSKCNAFILVEFSSVLFSVTATERLAMDFHLDRAAKVCKIGLIIPIIGQIMN